MVFTRSSFVLVLNLSCSFLLFGSYASEKPSLPQATLGGRISTDPSRGLLVDEDGRDRIFHGTNVVYKGHPYVPPAFPIDTETSFGEADMQRISSWGMNNIRLGVSWAGAEPKRGEYNLTYLMKLRDIVDALGHWGIYTYLDLHQDVFSERFCGNGFPSWVVDANISKSFPQPMRFHEYFVNGTDGLPSEADCKQLPWSSYYAARAVGEAFQNIYDNVGGVGDAVIALWRQVASVFKDCKWLLGYELMNEPWAGDHLKNPSIMYPGVADKVNLAPLYEKLAQAIQDVDTDHLIMYEPIPWNNFAQAGFEQTPTGLDYANQSVFAYHYYNPPDLMSPQSYLYHRTADARRLSSAGFLTEFSTSWNVPDKSIPAHDLQTSKDVIAAAENFTQSWSGWQYKVFHPASGRYPMTPGTMSMFYPNGTLDLGMVSAVSQPYARAVAGTIQFNKFVAASLGNWPWSEARKSKYILEYIARKRCKLPTEVYVDETMHFPGGLEIMLKMPDDVATVSYNSSSKLVHITHADNIADGIVISLEIKSRRIPSEQAVMTLV